ncbi:MAG: PAS domain S-box protein [Lachnospiraceae bacterium]|nr:PAS domain S-box protein [Lachnospiraceae bacterium]
MEQEMLRKEDFFRFADVALEIILRFDRDGKILYGNSQAKKELGYGEELTKNSLLALFPTELSQEKYEDGMLLDTMAAMRESMMYRKNGTCFPVRMATIVEGEQNLLFAINVAKRVETERKLVRMKEEMEETIKVRNEFVANVTHELRTPVNGIRGHVTNMLEAGVTGEQKRTLDIIIRCCENMSAIINNILDFSKLEAGKFTLEQKEFNFYQMINHAVETNITAINAKGLHIMVNIDKSIPEFLIGDELRLTQILNNLLSNAVKFTSVGYINIEVTKTVQFDDEIELFFVVSDTGIGISQEEKDKLFKSFSQVDASITRKYGGTGLGLNITKQLVELMSGSIHLDSEKGKGSSFSYSVRLHVAQDKKEEHSVREQFEFINQNQDMSKFDNIGEIFHFGTAENAEELRSKMEKLIICLEVGAWDKAETFSHNIKALVEEAPQELKKAAFRLEMNVRKEKYEKAVEQYNNLKQLFEENIGGM